MGPFRVIVFDELADGTLERLLPKRMRWSRHSSLIDRTNLSANAFKFGLRGGRRRYSTPADSRMARNDAATLASRSRTRYLRNGEIVAPTPKRMSKPTYWMPLRRMPTRVEDVCAPAAR
jgi:hypothetical protein